MRNLSLEEGNVIIDNEIQETMNIEDWIKVRMSVTREFIFLSLLSVFFFRLTFPCLSFFFRIARIHFMVGHPTRADARRNIIHCW